MVKKVCNILNTILFIALIMIASLLIVPNLLGYKSFAVISGSMEPNIHVGSIVYAKETSFDDLKVGDVISYKLSAETMVTHRIHEVNKETQTVITKGDANDSVDASPVTANNIVGKVSLSIPLIGYISIYAKTPIGIAAICGVVALIIILNYLPEVLEHDDEDEVKNNKNRSNHKDCDLHVTRKR